MWKRPLLWILLAWPSFLAACFLEMLVFAFVDPSDLHWFGSRESVSRQGVYTLSFFMFWLITALASTLSLFLALPLSEPSDREVN